MVLELSDGRVITPLNVFDVLETVEEYVGVDVRQYLEDYFSDEDPWADLSENEKFIRLREHYEDLLESISTEAMASRILLQKSPVRKEQISENLQNIITMIEEERSHYNDKLEE